MPAAGGRRNDRFSEHDDFDIPPDYRVVWFVLSVEPMSTQTELEIVRRAYAKQILAAAGVNDLRLELAFASIRREDFLGPGPWQTFLGPGVYTPTPSSDPVHLYTDDLIGIVPKRGINNGQPSLHAVLLSNAQIKDGEHVVHVGAGTGYYTAIIAHLVGLSGRVTAIEVDPELATQARANLSFRQNVRVLQANGADADFGMANVIYVSAGATHAVQAWLDGLLEAGRLILPLTTDASVRATENGTIDYAKMARRGAVFQITRFGPEFCARWICPAAYILAEGVRDKVSEVALALAFEKGDGKKVTRLYRSEDLPEDRCWLRGVGWCLAYE
jgi:protein-L-isoaspartate(D-aspartate) O-methyltransferase